jgi:hypothetical protein
MSQGALADRLPKQFIGTWAEEGGGAEICPGSGTVLKFEPKSISGEDYNCDVVSVQGDRETATPGSIVARFRCGGEGELSDETQQLSIHEIGGRTLMLRVTRVTKMTREDQKKGTQLRFDRRPRAVIYQRCP